MAPQALKKPNQPVGLKNQGATCYMNSFLQQLYAIEDFRNHLLELEDPSEDLTNSPLFQLQVLFGYVPLVVPGARAAAATLNCCWCWHITTTTTAA